MNGKDFERVSEEHERARERQLEELTDIIRMFAISPQMSRSIARAIVEAGWRKKGGGDGEKEV